MAQQTIDTLGQTDLLYQGFEKVNENFTEVYASIIQTGFVIDYVGGTAPSGWIFLNGTSIGNASSGADRPNADTEALFILLWNSLSNAYAPVSGGRGATAAADFAANKTLTIPDSRGKTIVGKLSGGTFDNLGSSVGSETHTLTELELPSVASHSHSVGDAVGVQAGSDFTVFSTNTSSPFPTQSGGNFGGGMAHNNIQPSLVLNKIIKL